VKFKNVVTHIICSFAPFLIAFINIYFLTSCVLTPSERQKLQAHKKCSIYFDSEMPYLFPSHVINFYETDKSDTT